MEKNITVENLIEKYEGFKSDSAKEAYLNQIIKFVDYIDFEVVQVICDGILINSCIDKNGEIKIDSCKKYLMYVYSIFDQYTNIEIDSTNWMKQFNMLYKNGLVDKVCKLMPERLMTTLDSVLKMKSDDMMTNYYEPHAFIKNQVVKYVPLVHKIIDKMLEGIENVDWNKVNNAINQTIKKEVKNE